MQDEKLIELDDDALDLIAGGEGHLIDPNG